MKDMKGNSLSGQKWRKRWYFFLGWYLAWPKYWKLQTFLSQVRVIAYSVSYHNRGGFKSGRTRFRYKYISLSENSRMNRRKDLYLFPSQKCLSLVRNRNVLIVLGTFLSLCFRLHVLEQFLSREVLVECHASLIDSTEPKYTIDTIKTGLH